MVVNLARYTAQIRRTVPILLDVAGFAALVIGTAILFGAWAWLVAGVLLILAGVRFGTAG